MKICQRCHEPYNNGGYKYCSEDCAKEAHHAQCRERAKRRYYEQHEDELARSKRYYEANREKKIAYFAAWNRKRKEATA